MPDAPLLIYHHLPRTAGTSLLAVVRDNYDPGEVEEVYGKIVDAKGGTARGGADNTGWHRYWYESLSDEDRLGIKCVASHTANHLMPVLDRPFRAFCLLRDPVERVWSLYHGLKHFGRFDTSPYQLSETGRTILRQEWSVTDLYRELSGDGPHSSMLRERFRVFFNDQTRRILAPWQDQPRLEEYLVGTSEAGHVLRDNALEILNRSYLVGTKEQYERSLARFAAAFGWDRLNAPRVDKSIRRGQPDSETRAAILAHNQLDAELHAHFSKVIARDRPRSRPPSASQRSTAVCVLGMSRSGTSLTARILNVLGVYLGAEEELMVPVIDNNPTGFWEHNGIVDLNEDILATLGEAPSERWKAWEKPPPLPKGWERSPLLEPHRRAARSILRCSFAGRSLWGWKDPRNCLTLPFWQQLVPEMRYVICVRHPLDVADSLQARDDMSREEAMRLWMLYMSWAIVHTSGKPRVFVSYEGYFPSWEDQATRLTEFLGMSALSNAQRATIADHLDEGLWHHREAKLGSTEVGLPPDVSDLYRRLSAFCRPHPEPNADMEAGLYDAAQRIAERVQQVNPG